MAVVCDSPVFTRGLLHLYHAAVFWLIVGCSIACSKPTGYQMQTNVVVAADAININTANADELEKLPHIGRKTAESIVEFRTANGPFRRAEHLMQIRGISEVRFIELRPFIKTE